jgi:hypothetical protein
MYRWMVATVLMVMLFTSCRAQPPVEAGMLPTPAPIIDGASRAAEIPEHVALVISRHSNSPGGSLHLVVASTGMDVPGQEPIPLGENYWHSLSGSGRSLAVVSYPDPNTTQGWKLHLVDLETWSDRLTGITLDRWPTMLAFSPDETRLAIGMGDTSRKNQGLLIVDVPTGSVLAERTLDFNPLRLAFGSEGSSLMVYGARYPRTPDLNAVPVAALFDAATLQPTWEIEIPGLRDGRYAPEGLNEQELHDRAVWYGPAVMVAPRSQRMYVVHADQELLTTIDFGGRDLRTAAISRPMGWLERLLSIGTTPAYAKVLNGSMKTGVLAPGGDHLYVLGWDTVSTKDAAGNYSFEETSLGLTVVALEPLEVVAEFDTQARAIALGPDGRSLLLGGWTSSGAPWSEVVSSNPLELQARFPGLDLPSGVHLRGHSWLAAAVSSSGSTTRITLLQTDTWQSAAEWSSPGYSQVLQVRTFSNP